MNRFRKPTFGLTVVLACLATTSALRGQDIQEQDIQDKNVSNVFLSTDLRQALSDVSKQVDVPILIGTDVEGTITLRLDQTPLPKALNMMLAPGGYNWRHMDGYILVGSSDAEGPLFVGLSESRRIKLSNLKAEAAVEMLSPALRRFVTVDIPLNRIIITGPGSITDRIEADVRELDAPASHVLLEARVVILESDALLDLGVEWDFPTVQAGTVNLDSLNETFPLAVSVGLTPGLTFTDSLMLSLNLMEENREASIVSHPQLTVRDGEEARMGVITEEFFQIETQESIDLEVVDSGTRMTIRPQIGGDGKITLTMDIEVSDVIGRSQGGQNENLPIVTRRTAQSTVQVVSGGTAAISGLMESRADVLNRQVPGAANLPLVGGAFNNDATRRTSKQLAVFITATVVEQPEPHVAGDPPLLPVDEEVFRQQISQVLNLDQPDEEAARP